ncbi:MAG: hypothetical protein AAF206_18200, partial [Bacteroidota bacterium]
NPHSLYLSIDSNYAVFSTIDDELIQSEIEAGFGSFSSRPSNIAPSEIQLGSKNYQWQIIAPGGSCGQVLSSASLNGRSGFVEFDFLTNPDYLFKDGELIPFAADIFFYQNGNQESKLRTDTIYLTVENGLKLERENFFGLKVGLNHSLNQRLSPYISGWHAGLVSQFRFGQEDFFQSYVQMELLFNRQSLIKRVIDSSDYDAWSLDFPISYGFSHKKRYGISGYSISAGYMPSIILQANENSDEMMFDNISNRYQHALMGDFCFDWYFRCYRLSFGVRYLNYLPNRASPIDLSGYQQGQLYLTLLLK